MIGYDVNTYLMLVGDDKSTHDLAMAHPFPKSILTFDHDVPAII